MSAWTAPPGMAIEHLHGDEEQPVHVAIVTLAPGAAMAAPETHDLTERIRLLSGDLCVVMTHPCREAPHETAEVPYDLGALSRCHEFVIPAGTPHRLVAWNRTAPAVYVVTMTRPREDEKAARDSALDDVLEAIRAVAEDHDEDMADAIVTAANVAIDSLRAP